MINNLIIGAGQLGSRHLQGMLKYNKSAQTIYVIDPSLESLNISKLRAGEIAHNHQLYFYQNWENLPDKFDFVIVATNADVREKVIYQLLAQCEVKYLILEKVLFTDLMSYQRVKDLLETTSVKTWVNHSRQMLNPYRDLKEKMSENFNGTFQVTGANWGLGCNGLHYIDFFEYLSGSKLVQLDSDWVDPELLESKRKGFIEFTGTIKGRLSNGSIIQVTSLNEEPSAGTITIFNGGNRFIIQESGASTIYHLKKSEGFKQNIFPFTMEFQSSLTTRLLDDILSNGSCNLPTYGEAKQTHELFVSALLKVYNSIQKTDTHILPIT